MTRIYYAALILGLAACAACSRPATPVSAAETPKRIAAPVARVTTRPVAASFDATGAFAADESSDVAPLVAGRVIATPVNAGDFVRQGQVVCELDHRDAQLRLD